MTLLVPGLSRAIFRYDNWGTNPTTTQGTSVTPGASNAEGSWTQIASSANIAQEVAALHLRIAAGSTNAAAKPHLLDIGVDPAGGTSYTAVISNIVCGSSPAGAAVEHFFPLRIPAGASVAVRIQGANATAGTVRVAARFYGQLSGRHRVPVGSFSETIGTITNSDGQSFTPGNAADGTWTSLGTTTNPMWWWQLCYQVNNATITVEGCFIDLAYGDGTNYELIQRVYNLGDTSESCNRVSRNNLNWFEGYCPVPAGATLYVRGRCQNAPDTGYSAVAVGIGG